METHSYAPVPLRLAMGVILSGGLYEAGWDCRHDCLLHQAGISAAARNRMVHYVARINRAELR